MGASESTAWRNPCGGVRWRFLPNGMVEFEQPLLGSQIPTFDPGSSIFKSLRQTWENFEPEFRAASEAHGVPAAWLLAVATTETGLWSSSREKQATIGSSKGAMGVMQIIPSTALLYGYAVEDMHDPAINIDAGAKILADLAKKRGDLLAALGPYNSGQSCWSGKNPLNLATANLPEGSYGEVTAALNNSALEHLGVGAKPFPWWLLAVAMPAAVFVWLRTRR